GPKISEDIGIGKRLARKTDRTRIDRRRILIWRRDDAIEQARFAQRPHELAASAVDVAMVDAGDGARNDETVESVSDRAVTWFKESVGEPRTVGERARERHCLGLKIAAPMQFIVEPPSMAFLRGHRT